MRRRQCGGERAYVVQHPDNPMLFLARADAKELWTTDIMAARPYRLEGFALRATVRHLNGRGHVLPLIMPARRAA